MSRKEKLAEQIAEKHVKEVGVPEELQFGTTEMVKAMVLHDAYNNPK